MKSKSTFREPQLIYFSSSKKKSSLKKYNLGKHNETFNCKKDILEINLRKKLVTFCVEQREVLNCGHFEKYIGDSWKHLKYVAGEEWRRKQVRNEEEFHTDKEDRNILQITKGNVEGRIEVRG
jgi:hypothetical protein